MKKQFRVTLWLHNQPFHCFCRTMPDVLDALEKAIGRDLSYEQRSALIGVMVEMRMRETTVECSLTAEDRQMHVSLAYMAA